MKAFGLSVNDVGDEKAAVGIMTNHNDNIYDIEAASTRVKKSTRLVMSIVEVSILQIELSCNFMIVNNNLNPVILIYIFINIYLYNIHYYLFCIVVCV